VADHARSLLNALVVDEDGRRWGERATPLQHRDADALLDLDGPRRHWIGRSRGFAKTDDLACITVAAMFEQLRPGDESLCVAADQQQASIIVRRIGWVARRTPELSSALTVDRYAVRTAAGARLEAMASDAAGSWGRSPRWVVADEVGQWPRSPSARELWDSVSTAAVKVRGRLAIISTAGSPDHWSRAIYEHAMQDANWRVSEVHEPAPWLDEADVEGERRRLPESTFARLFLNRWASSEDTLLKLEDVQAAACLPGALDPEQGTAYILGVDLGVRRDRSAVAVCHAEPVDEQDGGTRIVVDALDVFAPPRGRDIDLGQVEECVFARARLYHHAAVIFDPSQAYGMMQRLSRDGVRVIEHSFTATSNSKRALTLLEIVRGHRLQMPDDADLVQEFAALRLRELGPGLFRYDHDPSGHDDMATAIGLCAHHLLSRPAVGLTPGRFFAETPGPSASGFMRPGQAIPEGGGVWW
jgi:hypothetical protein